MKTTSLLLAFALMSTARAIDIGISAEIRIGKVLPPPPPEVTVIDEAAAPKGARDGHPGTASAVTTITTTIPARTSISGRKTARGSPWREASGALASAFPLRSASTSIAASRSRWRPTNRSNITTRSPPPTIPADYVTKRVKIKNAKSVKPDKSDASFERERDDDNPGKGKRKDKGKNK